MNHIIFFVKNQINQTMFKIGFFVLVLLSIGGMVIGYIQNYHSDLIFLRSAADNFLLTSTDCRVVRMMFVICFPLLAASLCTGGRKDSSLFPILRMDKKQYIYGNAFVTVVMTIISFMVVLGLNQLLCFAAFPLSGADNRWGLTEYNLINSFQKNLLFDMWSIQNPYVYNLLYIVIISILAGGISLLTYGLGYVKKLEQFRPVQIIFCDIFLIKFNEMLSIYSNLLIQALPVFLTGILYDMNGSWEMAVKYIPVNWCNYNYILKAEINPVVIICLLCILIEFMYLYLKKVFKDYEAI